MTEPKPSTTPGYHQPYVRCGVLTTPFSLVKGHFLPARC